MCALDTQAYVNCKSDGILVAVQILERHCQNPRQANLPQACRESFQWIWDTQNSKLEFASWLRSEGPLFWISGKPGAGKSTLMGYLVESKQTKKLLSEKSDALVVVHYFFHELGESQEKKFGGLLHAIVHQILINSRDENQATFSRLYGLLKPHLHFNLASKAALPDHVLMSILWKLVEECRETLRVFLFIDGFDECQGDHREQLDFLTEWIRSSSNRKLSVRACIASRVETEIELRLSNEPTFAIHQFTEFDIWIYVARKLGNAWRLMAGQPHGTNAEYNQSLIDEVVRKAEGVFVWVIIVVSQLVVAIEEDAEINDLYRLLAGLPEGLEPLYTSVIEKIDQKFWAATIDFLSIFQRNLWSRGVVAMTLLKFVAVEDPMSAISCRAYFEADFVPDKASLLHSQCAQMKRRLQRSCRGLVEIEDTKDLPRARVALLHLSVEQYVTRSRHLEKMRETVGSASLRDPAIALMAMSLRVLKIYPWSNTSRRHNPCASSLNAHDMQKEWHAQINAFFFASRRAEINTRSSQESYVEELDRVLSHSQPCWTHGYYEWLTGGNRLDWNPDLLSLAVFHNLAFYVQGQITTYGKHIIKRAHRRPLLFYACDKLYTVYIVKGVVETFEVLLNNGADPTETFQSETVWSAIMLEGITHPAPTARRRLEKALRLLLEHGADLTQYVLRPDEDSPFQHFINFRYWWQRRPTKTYTTVFHLMLSFFKPVTNPPTSLLKILIDHCNDFGASDSDGIGIQDWADGIDSEMGAFLRQEIAAKNARERRRVR